MKNTNQKFIFSLIASAIVLMALPANVAAQSGPSIRIFAMPQATMMLNADDSERGSHNYEFTMGTAFGLGGGYKFSDKAGLGLDLIYSMEGQKYTMTDTAKQTYSFQQKVNYLKIPLALTLNSNPDNRVMFAFRAGPQISLLLSSSLEDGDGDEIEIIPSEPDPYESMLIGAMMETGIDIRILESFLLNTGFRFDYSFGNSENEDFPGRADDRAPTNNITAGFMLGFKYLIGN
ncbi:MAG: outer membrane beta-barrel protein [Bacteroidia bacterium]